MLVVSDVEFAQVVARNITIAGVLRDLGRATVGTNYKLVHREVARLGLETSHWKGKRHSPGKQPFKVPWSEVLVENSPHPLNSRRKKALLREGLIENVCAECHRGPEWEGKPLVLRLDHINGVRDDNRRDNLRMLCPNCDSQTDTYCGRNKARRTPTLCECGAVIGRQSKTCRGCAPKNNPQPTKIDWPPVKELLARVASSSFSAVGRELGVSDNAIRKRLRSEGANIPRRGA